MKSLYMKYSKHMACATLLVLWLALLIAAKPLALAVLFGALIVWAVLELAR